MGETQFGKQELKGDNPSELYGTLETRAKTLGGDLKEVGYGCSITLGEISVTGAQKPTHRAALMSASHAYNTALLKENEKADCLLAYQIVDKDDSKIGYSLEAEIIKKTPAPAGLEKRTTTHNTDSF
jgi:hypothetical protein